MEGMQSACKRRCSCFRYRGELKSIWDTFQFPHRNSMPTKHNNKRVGWFLFVLFQNLKEKLWRKMHLCRAKMVRARLLYLLFLASPAAGRSKSNTMLLIVGTILIITCWLLSVNCISIKLTKFFTIQIRSSLIIIIIILLFLFASLYFG